ncbi:MAG: hypothetical protein LBI13_02655 [Streptococcaceae bacterium]|jgi:hypothetical protein|nr:hypothetical protein [Streptococcaceae bacterium]
MNLEKAIELVKKWIEEKRESFVTSSVKTEVIKDFPRIFEFSMDYNDCLAQIIVGDGMYTPYRFIAFEIVAFVDGGVKYIFTWYDKENDESADIIENLDKGLNFLIQQQEQNNE